MKKHFIILITLVLFASCEKPKGGEINSQNKNTIDSLTFQKESKTKEIIELNLELDSLRRLSDSLKAISQ